MSFNDKSIHELSHKPEVVRKLFDAKRGKKFSDSPPRLSNHGARAIESNFQETVPKQSDDSLGIGSSELF